MCKISKRLLWNIGQLRWETRGNGQLDVKQFRVFSCNVKAEYLKAFIFDMQRQHSILFIAPMSWTMKCQLLHSVVNSP